jgi:hypothetical protein
MFGEPHLIHLWVPCISSAKTLPPDKREILCTDYTFLRIQDPSHTVSPGPFQCLAGRAADPLTGHLEAYGLKREIAIHEMAAHHRVKERIFG